MTKRRAILLWPGGHTHEERVNCPSPELEDTPRVICIGYAPHYAYFILTHHDPAGTAHYRLTTTATTPKPHDQALLSSFPV